MNPRYFTLASTLSMALAAPHTLAQGTDDKLRTGEQVYQQTCVACHETGVAHAPRFGDAKAWAPLIEEGQAVLTAHAFVGVRGMPARGGDDKLSLDEFARATAYMARQAGGSWQDPDGQLMFSIRAEAQKRLDSEIAAKRKMKNELQRLNQAAERARKK